jgi:hypothetical protein
VGLRRECEIAWAGGLFEGEGTITQSEGRLHVRVKMTDEGVVLRFAEIARFGEIYGPYNHQGTDGYKRKPYWVWIADEYEALEVLEMLWPWLSERRRGQALRLAPIEAILLGAPTTAALD